MREVVVLNRVIREDFIKPVCLDKPWKEMGDKPAYNISWGPYIH